MYWKLIEENVKGRMPVVLGTTTGDGTPGV